MSHAFAAALLVLACAAQDKPMAKLAVAIGTVESKTGEGEWKPLAAGGEIPANTWIRTQAKSKGLFEYVDGTELRVNAGTEVLLESPRKATLKAGEIYGRISTSGAPFEVRADRTRIETAGTAFDIAHETQKKMTTVFMIEGKATVATRKDRQFLMAGYGCQTNDGALNTPDQAGDTTVVTAWVHELLAARGKDNAELERRMQGMLGSLGADQPDPYEEGFRSAGAACVPFLAKYVKFPYDEQEAPRRRAAAKILADLASADLAEDFVALLNDPDPATRVQIARGLKRLTTQDLGYDEKYWAGEKVDKGAAAWSDWLKKNPLKK